jgi:hypothetical protein
MRSIKRIIRWRSPETYQELLAYRLSRLPLLRRRITLRNFSARRFCENKRRLESFSLDHSLDGWWKRRIALESLLFFLFFRSFAPQNSFSDSIVPLSVLMNPGNQSVFEASGLRCSPIAKRAPLFRLAATSAKTFEIFSGASRLPRAAPKLRIVFVEVEKTVNESCRCLPGLARAVKQRARDSHGRYFRSAVSRVAPRFWNARGTLGEDIRGAEVPAFLSFRGNVSLRKPDSDFKARLDSFRSTVRRVSCVHLKIHH